MYSVSVFNYFSAKITNHEKVHFSYALQNKTWACWWSKFHLYEFYYHYVTGKKIKWTNKYISRTTRHSSLCITHTFYAFSALILARNTNICYYYLILYLIQFLVIWINNWTIYTFKNKIIIFPFFKMLSRKCDRPVVQARSHHYL